MVRQARAPRGDGTATWTRLILLLLTLISLLLYRDRLGTAGAGCFARVTGDTGATAPAAAPAATPHKQSIQH